MNEYECDNQYRVLYRRIEGGHIDGRYAVQTLEPVL